MSLLSWRDSAQGLPEVGMTVFIASERTVEPVWLGYFDGEKWMTVEGVPAGPVAQWAMPPANPLVVVPPTTDEISAAIRLLLGGLPADLELRFFYRDGIQCFSQTSGGIETVYQLIRKAPDQPGQIRPAHLH